MVLFRNKYMKKKNRLNCICPICKSKNTKLKCSNLEGYYNIKNDIFECLKCDIQFINTTKLDTQIYDKIYSTNKTPGYDRYFKYAQKIKAKNKPLKWLLKQEPSYTIIKKIPLNKNIKILEIGCGYGYFTYALNKEGYNANGIDISENAIKYAKKNYGQNNYIKTTIDSINQKYDLIIATELIEHLSDYNSFINKCYNLLNKNGKMLISTPNKDNYSKKMIWHTDLPPVHTIWFSKKSIEKLAKNNKFKCNFITTNVLTSDKNELIKKIYNKHKKNITPNQIIKNDWKKTIYNVLNVYPIRKISNSIYHIVYKNSDTMCVELIKM